MKKLIPILLLIILIIPSPAKKTTLRLKSDIKKSTSYAPVQADSLTFLQLARGITFSGFDKPAASRKETFLITNNSPRYIKAIEVEIIYSDPQGRMLHSRRELLSTPIPSGETRQVSIKSFDPQGTLYYIKSKPPKTGGQQFQVKINPTKILLPR